jgi:GTPase
VLADTVGFVRDLPHELVAAFRSTLAEAREADLLLHVIDAADPLREERIAQVEAVLEEIGAGDIPQLLVYNKIDRIEGANARHDLPVDGGHDGAHAHATRERVWVSARDLDGLGLLRDALGARLGLRRVSGEVQLPPGAGRLRARLHELGAVLAEHHDEHGWTLSLDLAEADAARIVAHAYGEPLRPLLLEAPGTPT